MAGRGHCLREEGAGNREAKTGTPWHRVAATGDGLIIALVAAATLDAFAVGAHASRKCVPQIGQRSL